MSSRKNQNGMAGQLRGSLLLMLAAFIWGVAFVAQSVGMEYVGPFTFISIRFLLGSAVLLPVILLQELLTGQSLQGRQNSDAISDAVKASGKIQEAGIRQDLEPDVLQKEPDKQGKKGLAKKELVEKELLFGGICCGLALLAASSFQQIGISHTTVGKAGFITALYIIFVPLFGIFFRRFPGVRVWIAVLMSAFGLYLLCMEGSLRLSVGDTYVFLCAVTFAVHILLVDHFSGRVDPIKLSCLQFFVCGLVAAVPMLLFEAPKLSALQAAAAPILYAGILSSGVAFTLQVVAQKDTNPTAASLIMSLESVFSVLAGWVLLGQKLGGREGLGCVLMFAAMVLAQLPGKRNKTEHEAMEHRAETGMTENRKTE